MKTKLLKPLTLRTALITTTLCFSAFFVTSCKPKVSEPGVSEPGVSEPNVSEPNASATKSPATAMQGVVLTEGWAKATVAGQEASGAYLRIRSVQPLRLLGGSSPAAQAVEVHEMRMDGEVMRMRTLEFLDIPANTTVELAPGGNHLMLLGLKEPLQAGSSVPITLRFASPSISNSSGTPLEVSTTLEVRSPASSKHDGHDHAGHDHSKHAH